MKGQTYTCKECGKVFVDTSTKKKHRLFCGRECYMKNRKTLGGKTPEERKQLRYETQRNDPNKYYVYSYLDEEGKPYYIGCGSMYRINSPLRKCPLPPKERRIKLKENLTREEGWKWEKYYIHIFGLRSEGGLLLNHSRGGGGRSGVPTIHTQDTKRRISEGVSQYYKINRQNNWSML